MILAPEEKDRFQFHGEFRRLVWWFTSAEYRAQVPPPKDVLVEGPAGTGKSRPMWELILLTMMLYPGIRWLVVRKTRASLQTTTLHSLRNEVLAPAHPLQESLKAANRDSHTLVDPATGRVSELVLGGMDHPQKFRSLQVTCAWVEEAQQLYDEDDAQELGRSFRWHAFDAAGNECPRMLIQTCNPDSIGHQLNRRALAGLSYRITTRHEDNPKVRDDEEYMQILRDLPPLPRARLYEGRWTSAEGAVFDAYDAAFHLLTGELRKVKDHWELEILRAHRHGWRQEECSGPRESVTVRLVWFYGAMDFGYRPDPGCLQIWGVDTRGISYRIKEVYRLGQQMEWWADHIVEFYTQFKMVAVACDSAEPRSIELLNQRMGMAGGHGIARKADKDVTAGIEMVNWALRPQEEHGLARMYFLSDALVGGADRELLAKKKSTCTEQEVPNYVYQLHSDGKTVLPIPDKRCDDHGCDPTRYGAMFRWRKDYTPAEKPKPYVEGQFGALLDSKGRPMGDLETLEREKRKRMRGRRA